MHAAATLLRKQKIATLGQLMAALGTDARRTAFRKLKAPAARASYSHCGRYYTLDEVGELDELELWCYEEVCFSLRGTLLETAAGLVQSAKLGCFVEELDNVLQVCCKSPPRMRCASSLTPRAWLAMRWQGDSCTARAALCASASNCGRAAPAWPSPC